jgi:hypothetical protein
MKLAEMIQQLNAVGRAYIDLMRLRAEVRAAERASRPQNLRSVFDKAATRQWRKPANAPRSIVGERLAALAGGSGSLSVLT